MKIDLHTMNESEARVNLQIFLVECQMKKVKYAQISHGYGDNVLRSVTNLLLESNPYTFSIKPAHPNQGGAGITLVEFDWNKYD